METWTQAVSNTVITLHPTYFRGSATAIRTKAGLVLIDTANAALAAYQRDAAKR